MLDAREAERVGLVNLVVPHEELEAATQRILDRLIEKPPSALGTIKSMLYRSLSMDMQSVLELEALALSAAFKTAEHREAVEKFLNRKAAGPGKR